MNEKIVLMNGKEYLLIIGDASSTPSTLQPILQTTEVLENIVAVFNDIVAAERIKTIDEDSNILAVYDDYTVLDNPKSIDDHYLTTPKQYGENGTITSETMYDRVAMLKLSQPAVEATVGRNRVNINFLTITTGTDL